MISNTIVVKTVGKDNIVVSRIIENKFENSKTLLIFDNSCEFRL